MCLKRETEWHGNPERAHFPPIAGGITHGGSNNGGAHWLC